MRIIARVFSHNLDPKQKLTHWMMFLLDKGEYRQVYDRIGTPALEDQFDDPKNPFDPNGLEWMKHFRDAIRAGIFPEITVLAFVAKRFGDYIESKGAISLDEAFGLEGVQRIGNPSKKDSNEEKRIAIAGKLTNICVPIQNRHS